MVIQIRVLLVPSLCEDNDLNQAVSASLSGDLDCCDWTDSDCDRRLWFLNPSSTVTTLSQFFFYNACNFKAIISKIYEDLVYCFYKKKWKTNYQLFGFHPAKYEPFQYALMVTYHDLSLLPRSAYTVAANGVMNLLIFLSVVTISWDTCKRLCRESSSPKRASPAVLHLALTEADLDSRGMPNGSLVCANFCSAIHARDGFD